MTVEELKEKLEEMPNDAIVLMRRSLVGDEHYVESINYEKTKYYGDGHGVVWICDNWE